MRDKTRTRERDDLRGKTSRNKEEDTSWVHFKRTQWKLCFKMRKKSMGGKNTLGNKNGMIIRTSQGKTNTKTNVLKKEHKGVTV